MANITDIERLNYYEGEFLGALDFQTEQEYHRDMRRRHNLGQHTWGIVSGLDIAQVPVPGSNSNAVDVYIQPGMAVDGFGREIVVLNKTQLTLDLFAAYINPGTLNVWISYAEVPLNPPSDPCTAANQPNAFGRVQEAFALSFPLPDGTEPTNDLVVVDNATMAVPVQPSPPPPPVPAPVPGVIVLPYDDSVPYQEFPTDDSTAHWYVLLGHVSWDPTQTPPALVQIPDSQAAKGRQYVGSVTSAIFTPGSSLVIQDRFAPNPLPKDLSDPTLKNFYGGVGVEVVGSLSVDRLLEAKQNILIDGAPDPANTNLSPLTINASSADKSFIQFRDSFGTPNWSIWEKPKDTTSAGLNIGEPDSTGTPTTSDLFIQKGGNIGIGTNNPQQNLSVNSGLNIDQGHSNGGSKLNPGLSFGLNGSEGIASNQSGSGKNQAGLDFYTLGQPWMRISSSGSVNIGTPTSATTPTLSVSGVESASHGFAAAIGISNTAAGGRNWYFRAGATGTVTPAGGLSIADDVAYRLVVDSSGQVGIGTPSPTALLDVAGDTRVEGSLRVIGKQNIFGVKTFLMALANQNTNDNFRAWNVDYSNVFESVYTVFAVFQGFSVYQNNSNLSFDNFGHVQGGRFIPQHAFVRVDFYDLNTANGVCFCQESDSTQEGDNTVLFTVVVLGKPKF